LAHWGNKWNVGWGMGAVAGDPGGVGILSEGGGLRG